VRHPAAAEGRASSSEDRRAEHFGNYNVYADNQAEITQPITNTPLEMPVGEEILRIKCNLLMLYACFIQFSAQIKHKPQKMILNPPNWQHSASHFPRRVFGRAARFLETDAMRTRRILTERERERDLDALLRARVTARGISAVIAA